MQAEGTPLLRPALLATVLLIILAIHRAGGLGDGDVATRDANLAAEQAMSDVQAAKDRLEQLICELDQLEFKIARLAKAIRAAENERDRAAAEAQLEQIRQEQAGVRRRAAASRALAHCDDRLKSVCVPPQCIVNPLAKGC